MAIAMNIRLTLNILTLRAWSMWKHPTREPAARPYVGKGN
jgi:hypothetical protein